MPSPAQDRLGHLAVAIYEPPLSAVRDRPGYPDLENPLHLAILLLDADTAITMEGFLGFLENGTGRHLRATREALRRIGAFRSADLFAAVEDCMRRHAVTWERLRADLAGGGQWAITTFAASHPDSVDFAREVSELARGFELFNNFSSLEDAYSMACEYLDLRLSALDEAIAAAGART